MIEFFYALFLLSGLVKSFLIFFLPGAALVDFTLVCALILAGWYILHFSRNFFLGNLFHITRSSRSIVFTSLGFYLWMMVTLLYTRSPEYSYIKTFTFLTVLLAVVFPFIYRGFDPGKFFRVMAYLGTGIIFIYVVLFPNLYASYLRSAEYRDAVVKYLDIGYLAGAIILIVGFACPRMKPPVKIISIGVCAWALMVSAARGPLLFLVLVLAIRGGVNFFTFLKKSWKLNLKTISYALGGVGIFAAAVYYLMDKYDLLIQRSIERLLMLVEQDGGSSIMVRVSQVSFSLEKIFENAANFLFGLGIGSFGIWYEGVDERNYPHNAILEIGFETGIIGVILFILLVILYFKKIRGNLNFLLIFIYLFLNSMKSYSLVDSRIMFGILSVLVLYRVSLEHQRWVTATRGNEDVECGE